MSEAQPNGPLGERAAALTPNSTQPVDLQAECEYLRLQLQQVSKERDDLQKLVTLLEAHDQAEYNGLIRFVRDAMLEGPTWTPSAEDDRHDFRNVVEELEKELSLLAGA